MKKLFLAFFTLGSAVAAAQNVGIGTLTPSDQLHTTGTVRFENYRGFNTRIVQMDAAGKLIVPGPVNLNPTPQAIPDNGCAGGNGVSSQINVFGQNNPVSSSKISVRINVTHTFDGDLRIYLYPPSGGGVLVLASGNGSNGVNFTNTIFTDQATLSITSGTAPFTGQYMPKGGATECFQSGTALANFAAFNGGNIIPNGTWTLRILDNAGADVGTLNNWSISFSGPEAFTSADATNYIAKFNSGNLVSSNIYQQPFGAGNIGINTTTPAATLEIKGNMKIDYALPAPLIDLSNTMGNGIVVSAPQSFAVRGTSSSGTGLYGYSDNGKGIEAYSPSGTGAEFSTSSGIALRTTGKTELNGQVSVNYSDQYGSAGTFTSSNVSNSSPAISASGAANNGFGLAIRGTIPSTTGTVSTNIAISGEITGSNDKGIAVKGFAMNATGTVGQTETGIGVQGLATTGIGVYGLANGVNGTAAYFVGRNGALPLELYNQFGGDIAVFKSSSASSNKARIDATGKGFFNGGTQTGGADVAEAFAVEGTAKYYEPGDVLVISKSADRTVSKSTDAYSPLVAGVYATKPGVLLTERTGDESQQDLVPMGVVGVIPTKVCIEGGIIRRGDLLVTSSTPGRAMKGAKGRIDFGTVIGKALEDFDQGNTGIIKVLVNVR